ncbi:MAG: cytochrome c oxidase assembly protein [Gammaproteobacteria bacterium]|nr:cytochrome c oxidase assembly protein [Gammaproteobacteria bacterium]
MSERAEVKMLTGKLLVMAAAMFGFGFLLVPIYDVFCEITGLNGKTGNTAQVVAEAPNLDRLITVEFTGTVNQGGPWEFRPAEARMQVHPGKLYATTFFARNTGDSQVAGQAVPSVTPGQAAAYFRKTECFCFTRQDFAGGEAKDMPLRFMLDPDLPAHVETVTLSYTMFATTTVAAADGAP